MEKGEVMNAKWVRGRCLGRGSYGTVSLAVFEPDGRVFAVKSVEVSSSGGVAARAMEDEIRVLKSLSSPYVVKYIGDDVTAEVAPVVARYRNLHMEYVAGGTVAEAAARGEMDERWVRAHARRVVLGLEYLHSQGVVHGDVKGRNVLAGPTCGGGSGAKLADFGSAVVVGDVGGWPRGTPLWMAPEVARGEPLTPAADIWSLGCTVIEMATGRVPWRGSIAGATAAEAMYRIGFAEELPKFPANLPDSGMDFLRKCLVREAGRRWTVKQLLRHPFVAEAEPTEWSPRSVLDIIGREFADNDDKEEEDCRESSSNSTSAFNQERMIMSARDRIRRLACERRINWESEGWELVRGLPQGEDGEEVGQVGEGQGMRWEYSESCCEANGDSCGGEGLACEHSRCTCRAGLGCQGELRKEKHCECKRRLVIRVGSDTFSLSMLLPSIRGRHDLCQGILSNRVSDKKRKRNHI